MRESAEPRNDLKRTWQERGEEALANHQYLIENNRLMLNRSAEPMRISTPEIGC